VWTLEVGDKIEFWSGENGGCWKLGIIVEWHKYSRTISIRIQTGENVTIVRPITRCREVIDELPVRVNELLQSDLRVLSEQGYAAQSGVHE
jgi:hypothetical protein